MHSMLTDYLSVMVSLQDVTIVAPAAVARDAWMAETSLKRVSQYDQYYTSRIESYIKLHVHLCLLLHPCVKILHSQW